MIFREFGLVWITLCCILFAIAWVATLFVVGSDSVKITIQKDYLDELQSTEDLLEECELSKVPECTPVNCGASWPEALFMLYMFGCGILMGYNIFNKKKDTKKSKEKKK